MATEVKVPVLGESITEATLGEWLKQPGDKVALDEPVASLETDKVSVEVGSPAAGIMGPHAVQVGDNAQAYLTGTYYHSKVFSTTSPSTIRQRNPINSTNVVL
ncbi:hypothetical protein QH494_23135, partial [Sphingomonas sp. AR_OL41]|uniref:biotin/lipoyl-containing protein n=1 Tax=Sphingomonas sp. AR_OL41 TaxID=3042729 RepID=UPI00248987E7|nr:hypothetical protein [Sphingomonas sp. AR_OL41]